MTNILLHERVWNAFNCEATMINTVIFVAERREKEADEDNFINCVPSVIPKGILNASPS